MQPHTAKSSTMSMIPLFKKIIKQGTIGVDLDFEIVRRNILNMVRKIICIFQSDDKARDCRCADLIIESSGKSERKSGVPLK